jgi:hypothetical protein
VPGLPFGWQLLRLPEISKVPKVLEALKHDNLRPFPGWQILGAPVVLGALKRNDLYLYSISLLYSLIYNDGIFKRADNYTILFLRHYINGFIDLDKINKFLKVWANWNK